MYCIAVLCNVVHVGLQSSITLRDYSGRVNLSTRAGKGTSPDEKLLQNGASN